MDKALVEDAEDDIDGENRRCNQQRLGRQRALKCLSRALERSLYRFRKTDLPRRLIDCVDRIAQRGAGREVER
jgi:hypothetical protein